MKNVTLQSASVRPPRLVDQLRRCIPDNYYSLRTERAYVYWARWFIRFHGLRHPCEMGGPEIQAFLSYLVNERNIAAATYTQALLRHSVVREGILLLPIIQLASLICLRLQ